MIRSVVFPNAPARISAAAIFNGRYFFSAGKFPKRDKTSDMMDEKLLSSVFSFELFASTIFFKKIDILYAAALYFGSSEREKIVAH